MQPDCQPDNDSYIVLPLLYKTVSQPLFLNNSESIEFNTTFEITIESFIRDAVEKMTTTTDYPQFFWLKQLTSTMFNKLFSSQLYHTTLTFQKVPQYGEAICKNYTSIQL